MKLLINICSHDGIISHYNGVGSMTIRYIKVFKKLCDDLNIDYELNLFTPEYCINSFGYNEKLHKEHKSIKNCHIYQIDNGSNGEINFGTIENWQLLCHNTAKIINNIDKTKYDKVLTICNDTPFCCLINELIPTDNHLKVLVLHSSIKIHKVDSAIEDSNERYNERLNWELKGINFINNEKNSYVGTICNYFKNHLINEYGLKKEHTLDLTNGELLYENNKYNYTEESKELFKEIQDYKSLIISYGRAEEYKNLTAAFKLGKEMNIPGVVIGQLYYKGQPIEEEYKKDAIKYGGKLYIDPPFDLPKYILNNFKGNLICLIPSKEEIMGLIINEVRRLNKDNILIVANNIGGLKEQITTGYDGVLVDLNNIKEASEIINKYFNSTDIKNMSINSQKTIKEKYDFYKIAKQFLERIINR